MKSKPSKRFALVLAALMLTAVCTACEFSIGRRHSTTTAPWSGVTPSNSTAKPNYSGGDTFTPTEPTQPRVSIDQRIVGKWGFMAPQNYYYFNSDGSFQYIWSYPPSLVVINGNWATTNGEIHLTDLVAADNKDRRYKGLICDYSYGTDGLGEYLFIPQLEQIPIDSTVEQSYGPKEFRRTD
jgi:hypothetical protein